jgi:peptide/nickel transport system permease protein
MPGNPFLQEEIWVKGDPDFVRRQLEFYGLDKPLFTQFVIYLENMFAGDWGESMVLAMGAPVWELIRMKFPVTLELCVYALLLSSFIGVRTGVYSATHKNKPGDSIIRTLSIFGAAIPVFALSIIMQYFFSVKLSIFPTSGIKSPGITSPINITSFRLIDCLLTGEFRLFIDTAWHLFLPLFCLTSIQVAAVTRITRSSMLEVIESDYVRSARAKGCKEKDVTRKHALKNAIIPTVTIIGNRFATIFTSTIFLEITFSIKGIGVLFVEAIFLRDYFIINGVVFIITILFSVTMILVDLIYAAIDPRIRF